MRFFASSPAQLPEHELAKRGFPPSTPPATPATLDDGDSGDDPLTTPAHDPRPDPTTTMSPASETMPSNDAERGAPTHYGAVNACQDVLASQSHESAQHSRSPSGEISERKRKRRRIRAPDSVKDSFRPSLTLVNSGSVARDHLASERTFLAYVRTSLAMSSMGVGK
jgi:hypothetical protein